MGMSRSPGSSTFRSEDLRIVAKKLILAFVLVVAACLQPALTRAVASEQPLTQDDVTLLLLGGSTADKLIPLIEQRGIDFQMNPDLAKKFHDSGASDQVIEALQKASVKTKGVAAAAATTSSPTAQPGSQPAASAATPPPAVPNPTRGNGLADPSPGQIQQIIQEFATKEKLFKEARNNYVYHQINKVQELGPDGDVVGVYEQEWDILYEDRGKRIER